MDWLRLGETHLPHVLEADTAEGISVQASGQVPCLNPLPTVPIQISGGVMLAPPLASRSRTGADVTDPSGRDVPTNAALYQAFFEASLAVMLIVDPVSGQVVDVNRAACRFYGYSREHMTGMAIAEINCLSADEIATEMACALAQQREYCRFRHRLATGEVRDVNVLSSPIELEHRRLLASVVFDVTEKHRTEQALAGATDLVRTLSRAAEQSPVSVVITDPTGAIEYVNPKFREVTGYSLEEVLGQNPRLLKSGITPPDVYAALWRTLCAGDTWTGTLVNRKKNGQLYSEQASIGTVRDEHGRTTHYVGVKDDITEQRRVDQAFRQLAAIVESSQDAIIGKTLDGVITSWNHGAEQLYGYTAAEVIGRHISLLLPPDGPDEIAALMDQVAHGSHIREYETQRRHKDGHLVPIAVTISPVYDQRGAVLGAAVVARDISARKAAEAALVQSEAAFRELVENAPIGAYTSDDQGHYESVNEAFAAMVGYSRVELVGQHVDMLIPPSEQEHAGTLYAERVRSGATAQEEYEMLAKGGERLTVLGSSIPIASDASGRVRRASFVTDITQRKQMERLLTHTARHDALTGLPNRVLFADRLEQALRLAHREHATLAVLMLDLDGFKAVNDTLGHAAGDEVLRIVSALLQAAVRESDTVARHGGDEFALLLPLANARGASRVAREIRAALAEPVLLHGGVVSIGASIGIALYPEHGEDAEGLLQYADQAMYAAKSARSGYRVHEEDQPAP